jgi:hypothetical protein
MAQLGQLLEFVKQHGLANAGIGNLQGAKGPRSALGDFEYATKSTARDRLNHLESTEDRAARHNQLST